MCLIDLSFIILTWNSKKYLDKCFGSIVQKCRHENFSYEVIIIDNGSSDNSSKIFEKYQKKYPDIFFFILLPCNRGTTYSRNIGLKRVRGRNICILDSDTEFGEESIGQLLNRLQDEKVGIVAPRLLLSDGRLQNSVKKFPTFLQKLFKIPKAIFGLPMPDGDFYEKLSSEKEMHVDSAISACWFFRRELLEVVGFLDEKIFYSPEDLDYCMRMRKAGKKIIYFPQVTVIHHTQQISHTKPFSKTSMSHFISMIYYFRKHGGWISNRRSQIDK